MLESVPEVWVWSLPPTSALDALEELGTGRLKRHDLLVGIVLVPTVMQPEWLKRFVKVIFLCDRRSNTRMSCQYE
jgi:hypothetical protein